MKLLANGKVSVYDPRTHSGQGSLVEMPVERVAHLFDTHVVFNTEKEYRSWLESEKAHAEAIKALTQPEDEDEDEDEGDWQQEYQLIEKLETTIGGKGLPKSPEDE